jgi:hypothetical protein
MLASSFACVRHGVCGKDRRSVTDLSRPRLQPTAIERGPINTAPFFEQAARRLDDTSAIG